MIILDTNVVSERFRPVPHSAVLAWLRRQDSGTLFLSAPGWAELLSGAAFLPDGQKKRRLQALLDGFRFEHARIVLPFDERAAVAFAKLVSETKRTGSPIGTLDGQIAAVALAQGCAVATRDTSPFQAAGVPVINPWLDA